MGMQNDTATLENGLAVLMKLKIYLFYYPVIQISIIFQEKWKCVHTKFINGYLCWLYLWSPKTENNSNVLQLVNEKKEKDYIHIGKYCSAIRKNKLFIYIYISMDESQMHYAKWRKPDSKGYILYDFTYMIFCRRQNCTGEEYFGDCHRLKLKREVD